MLDLLEHLLQVRSKEELRGTTFIFKDEDVSLVLVLGPCLAVVVVELLSILESMT